MNIGNEIMIPGGFIGCIIGTRQFCGEVLYSVSFFNDIAGEHQTVDFYKFQLKSLPEKLGFQHGRKEKDSTA